MNNNFLDISIGILILLLAYMAYDTIKAVEIRRRKLGAILVGFIVLLILFSIFRVHTISSANPSLALQFSYINLPFLASIVIISSILPLYYTSDMKRFIALFLLLTGLAIFGLYNFISFPIVGLIGIGSIIGLNMVKRAKRGRKVKQVETSRDIFQIILGVAFLVIFLILKDHSTLVVVLILMGAYIGNSLVGHSKGYAYRFLSKFERERVLFGLGALYLISGLWLLIGFLTNINVILFGIVVLFIADPMATIIGIRSKLKLPYNKAKSIAGTLSYFAFAAILGYFFIGYYAIILGAILAIVESLSLNIDDNASVAISLIIIYYAVFAVAVVL